ncbi:TniQ family protein [Paraburkholderia strydomiana]|uniref:TniQ family protein n=1 Tax=Paraburkholderia strydomiana TaxID=1245417 RepID=A0ABW9EQ25_9BURK
MMLVRTPFHASTESLLGYALRLSETNGYGTPWHILKLAGIAPSAMTNAGFPVAKLAAILGRRPEALRNIAYMMPFGRQTSFVVLEHQLGGSLTTSPFRLQRPALCPECVSDRGYIEAFFDLSLAVACPVHGRELLSQCERCGNRLTHFRPGLLICRCGASLAEQIRPTVSARIIALMAILKANLERVELPSTTPVAGFPTGHLLSMPLRSLLTHLPKFGRFNRGTYAPDSLEFIDGVAEALEDWPHGFHRFLDLHGQSKEAPSFHKRFEQFSELLFGAPETRMKFNWLHSEFLQFGLAHEKRSYVDPRAIPDRSHERRRIPLREFSRRTGHDIRSLEAWHQRGSLDIISVGAGTNRRYIVDTESITLPPRSQRNEILGERQAAAWIGMPVSVLERLRHLGQFPMRHHLSFRYGYHRSDLTAFRERLIERSRPIAHTALPDQVISLSQMLRTLRLHSVEHKAQLLIGYLNGELSSLGRTGDTLGEIFFDRERVTTLAEASRAVIAEGALTQRQAARAIGCDVQVISGLLHEKYLKNVMRGKSGRIDADSVEQFAQSYVPLARCAADWATSSPHLKQICRHARIKVLEIAHYENGKSPFINRRDTQRLHEAFNDNSRARSAGTPKETKPNPVDQLRAYLQNLADNDQPLPWRAGLPNKIAVARACGFDRDVFYSNPEAIGLFRAFVRKERDRRIAAGDFADGPMARLRSYLERLKQNGESLPTCCGRPNRSVIAGNAGVDRDLFYRSGEATRMLETFANPIRR